jgi:Mannosylglycerate hydrolase MGH1-like glycoside hydrolase domain
MTPEQARLAEMRAGTADWQRWGTYLSERAWGTVREDYSADGRAWEYFPHDHARSRAYRWNEDGLAGFCDRDQHLCLALALWNGRDPILKERLFGLSNQEGNHGEDVKECYYYLDNLPTHAYARMLYKYPQCAFPYADLVEQNARRGQWDPEYELFDAIGDELRAHRYFDVIVEYAKADAEDILCRIQVINRGPEPAPIHVLPHLWYRNTWSWTHGTPRPSIELVASGSAHTRHPALGHRLWYVQADDRDTAPDLLFTENDTNSERLFRVGNATTHVKDAIHEAVVFGRTDRVDQERGSKVAAHVHAIVEPGATFTVRVRLSPEPHARPFASFDSTIAMREREADAFYASLHAPHLTDDERRVQRQAYAGLLWSKQFYHFDVHRWLTGDPAQPPPPRERWHGRNREWALHLHHADVMLMPDTWEYPWYASWDLAFHVVVMAAIDPEFAKQQILLLMLPRTQHPYGTIPAFEWDFDAVNPPVLAWAAWQVFHLDRVARGDDGDYAFLASAFDGLVLMLGWWANRKDREGHGIFGGGFLGLDNIGLFDRDRPLPTGGSLEQCDGTGWMALFQLNMAGIAVSLARHDPRYLPFAHRFGQHFVMVTNVLQRTAAGGIGLWNDEEGFYFDVIRHGDMRLPLKVYSMVGLVPLFAAAVVDRAVLDAAPAIERNIDTIFGRRPHLRSLLPGWIEPGANGTRLLSVLDRERLTHLLQRVLDEEQFLSDYGVRSLSRVHRDRPCRFDVDGEAYEVRYLPGVSDNRVFGGNSNWRGPIWFPMNFLLIQALATFARYYGETFTIECPTGSGRHLTLAEIADDLARRLTRIFVRDDTRGGRRAAFGENEHVQQDVHWRDHILFHEFFHGESGVGLGASHQTGWTALVALLLQYGGNLCFDRMTAADSRSASLEVLS